MTVDKEALAAIREHDTAVSSARIGLIAAAAQPVPVSEDVLASFVGSFELALGSLSAGDEGSVRPPDPPVDGRVADRTAAMYEGFRRFIADSPLAEKYPLPDDAVSNQKSMATAAEMLSVLAQDPEAKQAVTGMSSPTETEDSDEDIA